MIDNHTLKARQFVREVLKMAEKLHLNCFVVTDGASGITNKNSSAVENARKSHMEWEKANNINPEHDWSENITDGIK